MQSTIIIEYEDEENYESIQVEVEYDIYGRDWPGTREEPPEYAELEIEGLRVYEFGREYLLDLEEVIEEYHDGSEDGIYRIPEKELEEILWSDYKALQGDYEAEQYADYMDELDYRYDHDFY